MRDESISLENTIALAVEAAGYSLWGVVRQQQAKKVTLLVYIDKETGVNIEDCAKASHQIDGVLAVNLPLLKDYVLEVSSPGLNRQLFKLSHYEHYIGQQIKLRVRAAHQGQRNFEGMIKSVNEDKIFLQSEKENYTFDFDEIERANLVRDNDTSCKKKGAKQQ